jgi:hypothetical protein
VFIVLEYALDVDERRTARTIEKLVDSGKRYVPPFVSKGL